MNLGRYAFPLFMIAVGGLAAASQEQASEQPVAEILGKPIYLKDLEPPVRGEERQDQTIAIDEEEKFERHREQLRNLVWGARIRGELDRITIIGRKKPPLISPLRR